MSLSETLLSLMPATVAELVTASGYAKASIYTCVARLKRAGLIHVARWVPAPTGQALAIYAQGGQPDAPTCRMGRSSSTRNRIKREGMRQILCPVLPECAEPLVSRAMRSQPALARVWA
jgi:hypothetical protein